MHKTLDDTINLGEDKSSYQGVELTDIRDTIVFLGKSFAQVLADEMDKKDVSSTGKLQDNIIPGDLEQSGELISVNISAYEYFSYQDQGVSGWANDTNSPYKFRTKGVDPKGEMVKSIKEWLDREKKSSAPTGLGKYKITAREKRGGNILDASTQAAVGKAYAIKKYGIPARHFTEPAMAIIRNLAEKELGIALKVDIINNLTK
jgi:hypothetical protein